MKSSSAHKPPEIISVPADADEVCCDGGDGALGHPAVWYSFEGRDKAVCFYCAREFIRETRKTGK